MTCQDIELVNAHGPYNHAVWRNGGLSLTHEEALEGRARLLASSLEQVLRRHFTLAEMPELSILDVGCYDGWLLHEISSLPLARLVGIEPRPKNIRKGEIARAMLGIETRVEFRCGSLDSLAAVLNGEQFDIVVATGLLHHVESHVQALRGLRRVCRRLLFLETIVLDSRHLSQEAQREIEAKDVIYFGRTKLVGLSGQKLESAYYDGSATGLQVVSLPSIETLELCCQAAGFSPPVVEAEPETYRRQVGEGQRPFQAAILTAEAAAIPDGHEAIEHGRAYERQMAGTILGRDQIEQWQGGEARDTEASEAVREIVKNIAHSPADKLAVEWGKILLSEGSLEAARQQFLQVTGRWNADWRSVYRSFHYLSHIARLQESEAERVRYRELLQAANAYFPEDAWPAGNNALG